MTFGSKQYAWSDISIALGGKIINGITEIEYTKKKEKEALYGRGSDPHAILSGKNTYEGKISIWQSELESMIASAPNKDVLALNFDVVVAYVPQDGGPIVVDILKNVEFTEVKKAMKQGDKNMVVELPIVFTQIKSQQ
ncbi:hypothetical protein [Pedobacter sp. ASV28]|jgi:hypothetical protein|uniref:hypothetical protein n=1 Tax=Pedobacter sp. ASV28 TaxID=2795123 RepID=UPI0018EAF1CB|nr:hypothetical protein [Pedobacter sp. ASV28]